MAAIFGGSSRVAQHSATVSSAEPAAATACDHPRMSGFGPGAVSAVRLVFARLTVAPSGNYELRITNYELRITNYGLRITGYELR
jgi:hypothetical protein